MNVLITGATGFVGTYIVQELLARGHGARCLSRHETDLPVGATWVQGDISDPQTLKNVFEDVEAVIHLVGIIEEHPSRGVTFEAIHVDGTRNVVKAARDAGIDTFIHMSANGADPDGESRYQTTKYRAEQIVKEAGFAHWTIFRPSLVFGRPREDQPEFCSQLVRTLLRPFPVWPVFGDGRYEMQPVAVEDVAQVFVDALDRAEAHGTIFCVAGPERHEYMEILRRIADGAGIKVRPMIHQPIALVKPAVRLLGGTLLPITIDQLTMLLGGNTCDPSKLVETFDLDLTPFTSENLAYLKDA